MRRSVASSTMVPSPSKPSSPFFPPVKVKARRRARPLSVMCVKDRGGGEGSASSATPRGATSGGMRGGLFVSGDAPRSQPQRARLSVKVLVLKNQLQRLRVGILGKANKHSSRRGRSRQASRPPCVDRSARSNPARSASNQRRVGRGAVGFARQGKPKAHWTRRRVKKGPLRV